MNFVKHYFGAFQVEYLLSLKIFFDLSVMVYYNTYDLITKHDCHQLRILQSSKRIDPNTLKL